MTKDVNTRSIPYRASESCLVIIEGMADREQEKVH
jgi:hypothetical protein